MTRINVLPPALLSDEHIGGEYKELPRAFTYVRKWVAKGYTPETLPFEIPPTYLLGKGHVKFCYNKCRFLANRFAQLADERITRGHNLNAKMFHSIMRDIRLIPECWMGDYKPGPEDFYLNMARVVRNCDYESVLMELAREE